MSCSETLWRGGGILLQRCSFSLEVQESCHCVIGAPRCFTSRYSGTSQIHLHSSSWGHESLGNCHLNEMLSGRQMLLLFCYGCLSPKFSDRALYSWVLCCCLQSELKWLNVINTLTLVGLLSHYSCTYISFTFLTNPQFRARLVVQMNSAWNTYSLPAHDRCIYRLCLPEMKHSIRASVSLCLCRVFAWMRLFLWARLYILIVQFS